MAARTASTACLLRSTMAGRLLASVRLGLGLGLGLRLGLGLGLGFGLGLGLGSRLGLGLGLGLGFGFGFGLSGLGWPPHLRGLSRRRRTIVAAAATLEPALGRCLAEEGLSQC